jgi:hypothetical protein
VGSDRKKEMKKKTKKKRKNNNRYSVCFLTKQHHKLNKNPAKIISSD